MRPHQKNVPTPLIILAGVAVCTILFLIVFLVDEVPEEQKHRLATGADKNEGVSIVLAPVDHKTKTYTVGNKQIDAFWYDIDSPLGILFLFHGCSHSGDHWFRLPEEVKVVKEAIALKLLPISFSSTAAREGSNDHCWDHNYPYEIPDIGRRNKDLAPIGDLITELINTNGWNTVPITLLGASSGAMFASMIPKQVPDITFNAMVLYISPGIPKVGVVHFSIHITLMSLCRSLKSSLTK